MLFLRTEKRELFYPFTDLHSLSQYKDSVTILNDNMVTGEKHINQS